LKVTTQGFARAGAAIAAALRVPITVVQEGGYLCEVLPVNLVAFLGELRALHRAGRQ
jgi:acetoin utilization deacetylase AcuC-like enzyme